MQYFLLTGIILSAFHSFVLFSKNNKTITDYILGGLGIYLNGNHFLCN